MNGGQRSEWYFAHAQAHGLNVYFFHMFEGLFSFFFFFFFLFLFFILKWFQWDLLCSQAWVTQTITSIQMAGVLLGNLFCGQLADLIGRKPPLFLAIALMVAFNLLASFSTSWLMFAVIRFFLGLAMGLELTVHYNLMSEFTLARWRAWIVAVPSWAFELALFSLVAWLFKNWRYIHVATTCIGVPLLATWW